MIIGGYNLHLYCDYPDEDWHHTNRAGAAQFAHPLKTGAYRDARRSGWTIAKDRALCPSCKAAGRKLPALQKTKDEN